MVRPWEQHGWEAFNCRKIPFQMDGMSYIADVFIETGTDTGFTTAHALHQGFKELHTIDIDQAVADRVRAMFDGLPQVHVHHGDSREVLPRIINANRRTTFFLDAHYQGRGGSALDTMCPLLEELRIITSQPWRDLPLIIIDDARSICGEFGWPTMSQVNIALSAYTVYQEDGPHMNLLYCRPRCCYREGGVDL